MSQKSTMAYLDLSESDHVELERFSFYWVVASLDSAVEAAPIRANKGKREGASKMDDTIFSNSQ